MRMSGEELEEVMQVLTPRFRAMTLYARQWIEASTADDLVQEALTKLFGQPSRPRDPVAWMFRAVRNAAIDASRSNASRRRRERAVAESRREWFEHTGEDLIDAKTAEQAMTALPAEDRQIVILRVWGDLGWSQIADLMNLGLATVHDRYTAALTRLRAALEKPCTRM